MALVVMNVAKSYEIINCIFTSVSMMFYMVKFKHFSGVIW